MPFEVRSLTALILSGVIIGFLWAAVSWLRRISTQLAILVIAAQCSHPTLGAVMDQQGVDVFGDKRQN